MKQLFRVLLLAICLSLVTMSLAPVALADRGMVPISDVTVYGPGQKAIIAWDGEEEILILSTDVRADGNTKVLEILPLPYQPQIEKGDFASFEQVDRLIKEHFPTSLIDRYKGEGPVPPGMEIVFHEKIGAHDITVVKASDPAELLKWAEEFLKSAGIEHSISSPRLESLAEEYIARGIKFFVFDLIEVGSEPKSIEPIKYRSHSDFLYYPLKISTLAEGSTDINLFLLTPEELALNLLMEKSELPEGMEIAKFYSRLGAKPVQFKITQEELAAIDQDAASLFGNGAWLTAMVYHGDLARLDRDLRVYKVYQTAPNNYQLLFDYGTGRCTSKHSSEATIGTLGNTVVIYGIAITPTPCYELEARLDPCLSSSVYPPPLIIDIIAQAKPGACVECIGEVPFWTKIANLVPGQDYDVTVRYEGEIICQERIYLPLSSASGYVEIPDKVTLESAGTPMIGFSFQGDGEVLAPKAVVRIKVRGNHDRTHLAYLELKYGLTAIIEVNDVPAIIRLSQDCKLKIIDGQIFLDNGYRLLPVRVMPDEAAGRVKDEMQFIELKAVNDKAIYQVVSVTHGKLLGLVPREINIETKIDALSGEIIKREQPWWARFCW